MKPGRGWLIRLFFGMFFGLAEARAADFSNLPRVTIGSEGVMLRDWLLLGSFEAKADEAAVDVDFLSKVGQTEAACRTEDIARLASRLTARANYGEPSANYVDGADIIDFGTLYNSKPPAGSHLPQTAVYAACEILADSDREAWMLFGSDEGAKIWLNGEQRFVCREARQMMIYEDAVRLPLHRGANLLLIKVANSIGDWMMTARLEPDAICAARTILDRNEEFLSRAMIGQGAPLRLSESRMPDSIVLDVEIENFDGVAIRSLQLGVNRPADLTDMPRGLYRAVLKLGDKRYGQNFYLGSLKELQADMVLKCGDVAKDDRVAINLGTLLQRLEILQRPYAPGLGDNERLAFVHDNEYKAVYTATEIDEALGCLAKGAEAFRHRPGLHLRGFRSSIDDQVMHYRLFVPSSYRNAGAGLPLVIVMTTVFDAQRPYLESIFVANKHRDAERWADAAEKLGIGILWPGYRVRPYGNPIDSTHFDEVLAAVAADYRLDLSRLYLYGFCSAGMTASMEAVRHPERYAAIAYLNPVLHRLKNRFDDDETFNAFPTYRAWLQETDPLIPLAGIRNLPIWIIHDGADPDHGPLSHSVDFVEEARAAGNRPRFDRNKTSPPIRFAISERQLDWLSQQRRKEAHPINFLSDNSGGPLSRTFAERFILVEATGGGEADRAANQKLSKAFQESWRNTNYVSCRVILDKELTQEEEHQSHLVLLGNSQTNLVWQRLASLLPVSLQKDGVTVAGKSWPGNALALQAWCPHPTIPGKKIILIGSYSPVNAVFGTLELCQDGWFDYAVWDNSERHCRLVAAARYSGAK